MSGNSNPSINSPASSNHDLDTLVGDDALIATNLLQEFNDRQARHISVSLTDSLSVQYVPHSPTPSVQELPSPPPLRVRLTTEGVGHYPPISPGSAATILRMEDDSLTDTTRAVAHGLIATIQRRSTIADQRLTESRRHINQLQGMVHAREAEIRHIRNNNAIPDMPAGYEQNGGRVDIQVSSHGGENILARWIRLMGNGEVIARAGERANEPEYMVSLYLPSDYSTHPTALLPPWFLELLQANGGAYHTLAEAAHGLKHPAAFAEVERYSRHHMRCTELEVARRAITADIDKEDDMLQGIEHRMEAYGLHERLAALEGRLDIRQELLGRNNFVTRRPNSRRHRRGGPGGPL